MRSVLALVRFWVGSFLAIAAALQAQAPPVTIDYTGSLYGYYRMEPSEITPALKPVGRFIQARDSLAHDQNHNNLLLGMGDNFGPEFGAALLMEDGKSKDDPCYVPPKLRKGGDNTLPEILYKDDDRVPRRAECDNVLNFMMHAGYRAIVPGREDFMYTSRWLRASALLLKYASGDKAKDAAKIQNKDKKLYLLGANLRIESPSKGLPEQTSESKPEQQAPGKAAVPKANKYSLEGRCPLLFSSEPFGKDSAPCFPDSLPETLEYLDRLDRLENSNGLNATVTALNKLASADASTRHKTELASLVQDQVNIFLTAWGKRAPVSTLSRPLAPLPKNLNSTISSGSAAREGKDPLAQEIDDLAQLSGPCKTPKTSDEIDMCTYWAQLQARLRTLKTSLQEHKAEDDYLLSDTARKAAIRGILQTIYIEQENVGYTVATDGADKKILVIGVVGAEAMSSISKTNLDLCPGSEKYEVLSVTDSFMSCYDVGHPKAQVTITDPVAIAAAIVRAVELQLGHLDAVVVLAQMTHAEAEVLSARVEKQLSLVTIPQSVHQVDIVLSEAEEAYSTPSVTLTYNLVNGHLDSHPAPVFTPLKSYSTISSDFPGTVYEAALKPGEDKSYSISNSILTLSKLPDVENINRVTIASCLMKLVNQLKSASSLIDAPLASSCEDESAIQGGNTQSNEIKALAAAGEKEKAAEDELLLFDLLQKAGSPHPDVVLLESRDLQLDYIDPAYTGYEKVCSEPNPIEQNGKDPKELQQLCRLRIALDRVFWKGDFREFVAVKGTDLKSMIETSNKKLDNRAELVDRDITREWLVSYGIVQSTLTNVTQVSRNDEPLWIPVDSNCKGTSARSTTYCVGGTPLVDDQYYWVLTSDHLAQDALVYGILQKLPQEQHETSRTFLTSPLAHYLVTVLENDKTRPAVMTIASTGCHSVECEVTSQNAYLQQMPLWQMDFLKVIANFTSRSPVGGNQFVGNYFQGVSDARATAPSQQELDVEFANRITGDLLTTFGQEKKPTRFSEGLQTTFGYDRAVVGNLSPSTKPINASYALNNLTIGGFVQIRLDGKHEKGLPPSVRSLPRTLLVLTPYQYQIQINHQYLFFPFATSSPLPGELTVALSRNTSWTDRIGIRREFGSGGTTAFFGTGSYLEAGGEYISQNNVLSGVTLANGTTQKTCLVNANITLQTCFSQPPQFVITSNTRLVQPVMFRDLHSPGLYWNFHLQNRLFKIAGKQLNLVTDAQGDDYFGRQASEELPTQTEYAIPLSLSVVFPVFGNFSFAPTYSGFFYKSQLSTQTLQVNSFSITARWYLARDNRVPVARQSKLPGPESSDQTKSAKSH